MTNKEKSVLFGTEFYQNCESNSNFYIKKPKITLKYEKNLKGNFLMKQFVRYVINSIRYRRFCICCGGAPRFLPHLGALAS